MPDETKIERYTIGCVPHCDIFIERPMVGMGHGELVRFEEHFLIQDWGSSAGTYVDGKSIVMGGMCEVTRQSVISIGPDFNTSVTELLAMARTHFGETPPSGACQLAPESRRATSALAKVIRRSRRQSAARRRVTKGVG